MDREKTCAACGRKIEWRKKWENCWDEVKFCSAGCRKHRPGDLGCRIEAEILAQLGRRAAGASVCPGEVASRIFPDDWRERMEDVRKAARRLVAGGVVEITQGGKVVDPSTAKGPIRIRSANG